MLWPEFMSSERITFAPDLSADAQRFAIMELFPAYQAASAEVQTALQQSDGRCGRKFVCSIALPFLRLCHRGLWVQTI
jgi:hypothetical protein